MNKYLATGWLKITERDDYENGCDPRSTAMTGGHETFTAATIDALIEQYVAFVGTSDLKSCLLDSCDEDGRLDIQVHENIAGETATKGEIELWRTGEAKLWLATYTFQLLRAEKIVLSRNVTDKNLYVAQ